MRGRKWAIEIREFRAQREGSHLPLCTAVAPPSGREDRQALPSSKPRLTRVCEEAQSFTSIVLRLWFGNFGNRIPPASDLARTARNDSVLKSLAAPWFLTERRRHKRDRCLSVHLPSSMLSMDRAPNHVRSLTGQRDRPGYCFWSSQLFSSKAWLPR